MELQRRIVDLLELCGCLVLGVYIELLAVAALLDDALELARAVHQPH